MHSTQVLLDLSTDTRSSNVHPPGALFAFVVAFDGMCTVFFDVLRVVVGVVTAAGFVDAAVAVAGLVGSPVDNLSLRGVLLREDVCEAADVAVDVARGEGDRSDVDRAAMDGEVVPVGVDE